MGDLKQAGSLAAHQEAIERIVSDGSAALQRLATEAVATAKAAVELAPATATGLVEKSLAAFVLDERYGQGEGGNGQSDGFRSYTTDPTGRTRAIIEVYGLPRAETARRVRVLVYVLPLDPEPSR